MTSETMILAHTFCEHHHTQLSFIRELHLAGLIEVGYLDEQICLPQSQLPIIEKFIRMKEELHINTEGIESIHYLLERIYQMQQEIWDLKNRVAFYEEISKY